MRQVGSPELAVFISLSHTPPTPKAMWLPHLGALSPWGWLWRAQRAMIAGMTAEKVLQPLGMARLKPVLQEAWAHIPAYCKHTVRGGVGMGGRGRHTSQLCASVSPFTV